MKKTQDPKASSEKIFDYSHSSKGPPENSTPSEGEQQIQLDRDTQAAGNRVSRRIPESSSNVPKDAIAIDIPPEASRITRGEIRGSSRKFLKRASDDIPGAGAVYYAAQPLQYAANMGFNMGGFVLGELGYTMPSSRPGNDPTQISSCNGPGCSKHWLKYGKHFTPEAGVIQEEIKEDSAHSHATQDGHQKPQEEFDTPESIQEKPDDLKTQISVTPSSESEKDDKDDPSDSDLSFLDRDSTSSKETGDITTKGGGHYDPDNDAILHLEAMTSHEVRALNSTLWLGLLFALGVLLWQFIGKLRDDSEAVRDYSYIRANAVIGSLCLIGVTGAIVYHFITIKSNWWRTWKPRRAKTTILVTVDLVAQWLNLLFFIIPNFLSFSSHCFLFQTDTITYFVGARWTMWNIIFLVALIQGHNSNISAIYQRRNARLAGHGRTNLTANTSEKDLTPTVVADLPFWTAHWWKVVLWCCMECSVIATVAYCIHVSRKSRAGTRQSLAECSIRGFNGPFVCNIGRGAVIVTSVMVAFAVLYFLLYCFFIRRAVKQLTEHSNVDFKLANTSLRIQMRLRVPSFAFFILSVIFCWYVKPYSCSSVVTTWLGMLPGQIITSVAVICLAWIGSPKRCMGKGRPPLLQCWLQEFAWTKAEKEEKMQKRNASMAEEDRAQIEKEPMFCVEAMLVCLYWSLLIYDFPENTEEGKLSIEEACSLFRPPLDRYEMFWEKSMDTKCLMAWSRNEIVIVFRGTASLANVVSDVQAWRTDHLPRRGTFWRRPKIHSGFSKAWRNNGLNDTIFNKLKELFTSGQVDRLNYRVYVTGHSYGGSLATICSFELRRMGKEHNRDKCVTCVTFGAPRTGNHTWSREFNEMVPDCWNIINDQDLISRSGKFGGLYKRAGHRVIVNRLGDIICRPNPLEASLQIMFLQGNVQHHLLHAYLDSIVAVLLSQFTKKGELSGSMIKIVEIVRHNKPLKKLILDQAGLHLKDLVHMARWGAYAPLIAQRHTTSIASRASKYSSSIGARTSVSSAMGIDSSKSCGCCDTMSLWMEEFGTKLSCDCCAPKMPNVKDGQRTEQ